MNTSKLIVWAYHHLDTKTRQNQQKKIKLHSNITDEHRCKNPQQNSSKQNSATHHKAHTPGSSWVYSTNVRVLQFSSAELLSHVQIFATTWAAACQASLSITSSKGLLKLMSIESVMLSNHLILYHPLLVLPSTFASIRVFSNESALCIRWPKYWSFSFNISPSNVHSGLISFRVDWLDLLAVQGTLKSILQHQSSKASILQCSAFFIVQLSHPYMTIGKTIALTRWTFVGKVMTAF